MTLWSKIIWDKLGRSDIKLHEHSGAELAPMIMEWVYKSSKEEILDVISTIGVPITKEVDYYDGPFHRFYDEKEGFTFHDSQILPMVISMFLAFPEMIEDIDLIKSIAKHYHADWIAEQEDKTMTQKMYFRGVSFKEMAALVGLEAIEENREKISELFNKQYTVSKHHEHDVYVVVDEIGDEGALLKELDYLSKEVDDEAVMKTPREQLLACIKDRRYKDFKELIHMFRGMFHAGLEASKKIFGDKE